MSDKDKIKELAAKAERRKRIPAGSAIHKAYMEDEASKKASEERAHVYLKDLDESQSDMPNWMWNVLWFATGILFVVAMESIFLHSTLLDGIVKMVIP